MLALPLPVTLPRHAFNEADTDGLLLGLPQAAELLGMSRMQVWRRVQTGALVPDYVSAAGEALFHPTRIIALASLS